MITNYNLFLDDERLPHNVTWANLPESQHYTIVRNYNEFVDLIETRGIPRFVSYDHDLADSHYGHGLQGNQIPYDSYKEKTGYDCAKWLIEYCLNSEQPLPKYTVHSLNPIGAENIKHLLNNFGKNTK